MNIQRKTIYKAATAFAAAASLALSGCSSGQDAAEEQVEVSLNGAYNPQDRENLQQGGELRLALGELSEQQNPFQADGTAYTNTIWRYYNPQIGLFDGEGNFSAESTWGGSRKLNRPCHQGYSFSNVTTACFSFSPRVTDSMSS